MAEIRAIRWTDRLIRSEDSHLPTNDVLPIPHLSWNDGIRNNIESMVSILRKSMNLGFHFVRYSFWRIDIWRREKISYLSMVRDIPVSEGVQKMASQFLCSKND